MIAPWIYSFVSAAVFTIAVYNLGIPYDWMRYVLMFLLLMFSFLFATRRWPRMKKTALLFLICLPILLIDSSTLIQGAELIPLRFPFATALSVLGAVMGHIISGKNRRMIFLGGLSAVLLFVLSGLWFIPAITMHMFSSKSFVSRNLDENFLESQTFLDVHQNQVTLSSLRGKGNLIEFFFIPCVPCEWKAQSLAKIQRTLNSPDLRFIFICNGAVNNFQEFLTYSENHSRDGFTFLYDSAGAASKQADITEYPFELIQDKNGTIMSTFVGFDKTITERYQAKTKKILNALLHE